ncbi:MAG: hypothetical protein M3340_12065 [Actinomycetota bacterium]|nr:hypothetical protein [Actinomycetota bacterium]
MPTSLSGALAAAVALTGQLAAGLVALSENNATLLGVAMIGAIGSIAAAVIAAGNSRRIDRLERESEESK